MSIWVQPPTQQTEGCGRLRLEALVSRRRAPPSRPRAAATHENEERDADGDRDNEQRRQRHFGHCLDVLHGGEVRKHGDGTLMSR
jgi:hypothetical protein